MGYFYQNYLEFFKYIKAKNVSIQNRFDSIESRSIESNEQCFDKRILYNYPKKIVPDSI